MKYIYILTSICKHTRYLNWVKYTCMYNQILRLVNYSLDINIGGGTVCNLRFFFFYSACKSVEQVLKLMYQKNLMLAYPNLTIVYGLCLTLPVTTASVERSFSKLKLVNNVLRSTMSEPRLSSLLVLSIERDV